MSRLKLNTEESWCTADLSGARIVLNIIIHPDEHGLDHWFFRLSVDRIRADGINHAWQLPANVAPVGQ